MTIHPFRRLARGAALLTAALLAGCESPSGEGRAGPMAAVEVVSGNAQAQAMAGAELPEPLVVRVVDASGRPVEGQVVNFVVATGGGSVFAGAATTNAEGLAREHWTLGAAAGVEQRVEVRAVDPATGEKRVYAAFTAVGRAGAPAAVVAIRPGGYTGAAGVALDDLVAVRVNDRLGNAIPGVLVRWTPAQGTVLPDTSRTGADGVARTRWTLGAAVGAQQLTAAVDGVGTVALTAMAHTGTVARVELVPESLRFTALGQEVALQARAYDVNGNALPGIVVDVVSLEPQVVGLRTGPVAVALAAGTARIVATGRGTAFSDTAQAVVEPAAPQFSRLRAERLALHYERSCALDAEGRLFCWGLLGSTAGGVPGIVGCGLPQFTCWPWAVPIFPAQRFSRIDAEAYGPVCVLDTGGRASCIYSGTTVPVDTDLRFREIAMGVYTACALTAEGAAHCWRPRSGTYPEGGPIAPAPVGDVRFTSITAGADHACGITTAGTGRCWFHGLAAADDPHTVLTPGGNAGGMRLRSITAGESLTCAVDVNGQAYCWGNVSHQNFGQLGRGTETTGGPVASATRFTSVDANKHTVCALAEDGSAWCWGARSQPYRNDTVVYRNTVPTLQPGGVRFATLRAGDGSFCGVDTEGTVQCWGSNRWGNTGNGKYWTYTDAPEYVLRRE